MSFGSSPSVLRQSRSRRVPGSASAPRSRACRPAYERRAVLRLERRVREERIGVVGLDASCAALGERGVDVAVLARCSVAGACRLELRRLPRRSRALAVARGRRLRPIRRRAARAPAWRATSCRRRSRRRRRAVERPSGACDAASPSTTNASRTPGSAFDRVEIRADDRGAEHRALLVDGVDHARQRARRCRRAACP